MASNNEGKTMGLGAEMAREGYETSVVSRMAGRAGAYSPKGSAGNALEIMANDKSNLVICLSQILLLSLQSHLQLLR